MARAFVESLDSDQTWWRITQEASRALKHAQCLTFDYDHAGNQLVAVAASGLGMEGLVGQRVSLGTAQLAAEERRHSVIDVSTLVFDGALAGLQQQLRWGRALAVPLAVRGDTLGLMLFVSVYQNRAFGPEEVTLAHEMAELASCAVHNSRLYRNALRSQGRLEAMLNRMSQAREHEHKAFAAMVHDDVLQSVVGAVYALDGLRYSVVDEGLPDFDHVVHMLRLSVEDARKIIWELRPAVLDGLGLKEALGAITDRVAVESGTSVSTSFKEVEGLSEGLTTALYKIGREALLNAELHARATAIRLRLGPVDSVDGPAVSLTVSDNGVGFEACGERPSGHYGLVMMEEQAAAIGGMLLIESEPNEGTTVRLTVPIVRVSPDLHGFKP